MDIGKSFSFVFEDDRWVTKILIAAGILLAGLVLSFLVVPIIIAAAVLLGYSLEITRRVINGTTPLLPEWDNWGVLIVDGLKVIAVGVVYALPAILVSICLGIPVGVMSDQGGDAAAFGSLLSVFMSCVNFLWGIVVTLVLPAAIAFLAVDGQISSALRFSQVIAFVRNNIKTYLLVLVISWVAYLIGGLGSILCGIGLLATYPYAYMVIGHLYGQAYREATGTAVAPAGA